MTPGISFGSSYREAAGLCESGVAPGQIVRSVGQIDCSKGQIVR